MRTGPHVAVGCVLLTVLAGCGEELGATPIARVAVEGRVTDGSRPVVGGWIEFLPVDGATGHLRSAPLGADGSFRVTGLGSGPHVVRLVRPSSPGVEAMFQQFASPIRVTIAPGAVLAIDLARERLRARTGGAP